MRLFNNLKKKIAYLLAFILFAGAACSAYYFYAQYQKTRQELSSLKSKVQTNSQSDYTKIVDAVGKLMELPQSTPTVSIIKDIASFKGQPFFDQAKNDDVLLIYSDTKKAILYRPSSNKIIDITTVNISNSAAGQTNGAVAGASTGVVPTDVPLPLVTSAPPSPVKP
jgi:hypothetical protein